MELHSVKKQLELAEKKTCDCVKAINRKIKDTWTPCEILYLDAFYSWKRYKTDLMIKPDKKRSLFFEENFVKDKLAGLPGMNCDQSAGEMLNDVLLAIRDRLNEIDIFKTEIREAAAPYVCHVSPHGGIHHLKASKNKENMYCNEALDAVYGVTDYDELVLYIGRAVAESMHTFRDGSCIYKKNPVKELKEGKVFLRRPVYLYCADIDWFEPVTDFFAEDGYTQFCFGHEWICRRETVPPSMEIQIDSIPEEDWRQRRFYYFTDESVEKKWRNIEIIHHNYDLDFLEELERHNYIRRIII